MRGYPKGPLTKQDYENLLSIPEHAKRAEEDLTKLAAIDDAKITIDEGTADAPKAKLINNPMPAWKRAGFKDKTDLAKLAAIEAQLVEDAPEKL